MNALAPGSMLTANPLLTLTWLQGVQPSTVEQAENQP